MGFKECLNEVLKYEGTYSNHENDKGGETFRGISRKWHPEWDGWEIIDTVKETIDGIKILKSGDITPALGEAYNNKLNQLVAEFYKKKFWNKIKGEKLCDIYEPIACELLECAVHIDIYPSVKILQQAINQAYFRYIDVRKTHKLQTDGIIGKKTIEALETIVKYGFYSEMTDYFRKYRALEYAQIVRNDPSQAVFIYGWIKRALKVS